MYPPSSIDAAVPTPHGHASRILYAGATDTGVLRTHNEDRFGIFADLGLFVVADGMGGAAAGEIAAAMTVEIVHEYMVQFEAARAASSSLVPFPPAPGLTAAIQAANERIHDAAQGTAAWRGMGSTIVAAFVCGSRVALAHVGDSRVFLLRDGALTQLTEDHSFFNDCVRRGLADPERPAAFHYHNVITRSVGAAPTVEVDARLVDIAPGDSLLLCSDGLSPVVPHAELAAILGKNASPRMTVQELLARANQLGGPDNATAIVARWDLPTTRTESTDDDRSFRAL